MKAPIATAGMLIRRPVPDVLEAFVDPAITTRLWFTHSTGRLDPGVRVTWRWAMYGASTDVQVKAVEADRLLVDWDLAGNPNEIEWTFGARSDDTFVEVTNRGFTADDAGVARALDSAGGFALVLASAKIWLEQGIDPRIIVDRNPDHHVAGWREP